LEWRAVTAATSTAAVTAAAAAAAAKQQQQQQPTSTTDWEHNISQHVCQQRDSSNTGSDRVSSSSSGERLSAKSARCFDAITLNCSLPVLLPARVF
jgi:anti-sigma-K factor RskA